MLWHENETEENRSIYVVAQAEPHNSALPIHSGLRQDARPLALRAYLNIQIF